MKTRRRIRLAAAVCCLLATAAGCSGGGAAPLPDRCNVRIVTITPPLTTLHVGDNLTLSAEYTSGVSAECLPGVPAASLQWSSDDSAIAVVDSVTGTVTARKVGSTLVWLHVPGRAAGAGNLGGVQVTVTSAAAPARSPRPSPVL